MIARFVHECNYNRKLESVYICDINGATKYVSRLFAKGTLCTCIDRNSLSLFDGASGDGETHDELLNGTGQDL